MMFSDGITTTRHPMTPSTPPPALLRLLIVEDNADRIERFQAWLPADAHPVFATGPGAGWITPASFSTTIWLNRSRRKEKMASPAPMSPAP